MFSESSKRWWIYAACVVLVISLLTACGGQNSGETNTGGANTADDPGNHAGTGQEHPEAEKTAGERILVDPLGHEVAVPAEPQRIIASYLEDYLVALGVKPVAQWAIGDSPMLYLQSELEGVPYIPYDLPFEAVASFNPDLIIIGDEGLIADDKYASYAKIAPTYALGNEIYSDWRQTLLKIGEVLNKSEQARQVLDEYEAKAAEARAQIEAAYDTPPSVAAIWLVSKTFWVASDNMSSGAVLYQDLGLAVPEIVQTISDGEGGIWKSISMEALAQLDADHIFLINSDTAAGSEALQDPIWQSLPAVKNGNVHEYGPETSWLYTGPIANSQMIDDILESLIP